MSYKNSDLQNEMILIYEEAKNRIKEGNLKDTIQIKDNNIVTLFPFEPRRIDLAVKLSSSEIHDMARQFARDFADNDNVSELEIEKLEISLKMLREKFEMFSDDRKREIVMKEMEK